MMATSLQIGLPRSLAQNIGLEKFYFFADFCMSAYICTKLALEKKKNVKGEKKVGRK
jgi:hypothetical protein